MIRTISGTVESVGDASIIIGMHGMGLHVAVPTRALATFTVGSPITVHTHLHVKEDALDLYGFRTPEELKFFEQLISVSGVGPKSALAILDVGELKDLAAAITENRPDLLTQASGIGRKTAERIIIDLKGKVEPGGADKAVARMDADTDLVETLVSLGYRRDEARSALERIDKNITKLEDRLKATLGILSARKHA